MRLSIVTINYNSSENTIKLLESLKNQTIEDFEVIIVDNASLESDFDNLNTYYTTDFIRTRGALVKHALIKNCQNLGYSRGNNVGIRQALKNGADWVLLLNNDTWVESRFVERLRADLAVKQGIIGLALNEGSRTAFGGWVQWLKPTLKHIHSPVGLDNLKTYAIGGAMLVQKSVFNKIGFLDEKYFLYFEDADYTIRARKAGIPISVALDVMIYHNVSSSTKKLGSPMLLRYHYRNALYFSLKNGPWYIKLLVWPWSWWIMLKQSIKIVIGKKGDDSKNILAGIVDFYRNRMGKIKTGTQASYR